MDILLYKNRTVECGELIETEKNEFLFCSDGRIKAREFIELEDKKENLVSLPFSEKQKIEDTLIINPTSNGKLMLSSLDKKNVSAEIEIQDTNKIIYSELYDTFDFIIEEDEGNNFFSKGGELEFTIRDADTTALIEEGIILNEDTPNVRKSFIPAKMSITAVLKIPETNEVNAIVYPQIYKNNVNIQLAKGYKIKALNFKEVME